MKLRAWLAAAILGGIGFPTAASAACKLGVLAELPVLMDGAQPTVATKINGADARFVANSAAGFSIIFSAPAQALRLPSSNPGLQLDVEGLAGGETPWSTSVKRFELGGQEIPNVTFVVAGHQATPQAIGYIGQNILGFADTEYDLANGVIRLIESKGCGDTNLAYWVKSGPYSQMQLGYGTPGGPQFVGTAMVNGVRVRVVFNTGASRSVLSLAAAKRAGLATEGAGVKSAGRVDSLVGPPQQSWIAPVSTFQIGDETIKNTSIRVSDCPGADLTLGLDFFLSHRVYVAKDQRKIYLTYNGGPVFDLTKAASSPAAVQPAGPPPATASSRSSYPAPTEPVDADGYSRRAAAFEARGDLGHALADFDRAVDLAPETPSYLYRRATLHAELHQPLLAMNDLNAILKLKPDDADALAFRAGLRRSGNDEAGALADADAAAAAAAKDSPIRLKLGWLYERMDLYPKAIAQFDLWIASHDNDGDMARAHNGRCWARALADIELDKALADCNAALRAVPGDADYLDSRGLVHLRRAEFDRAIADYGVALAQNPKLAWSLYGRGLAELRIGAKVKGDLDIASALAMEPKLPERAAKLGLTP